jgi:hypothetical protein
MKKNTISLGMVLRHGRQQSQVNTALDLCAVFICDCCLP